MGVPARAIGDGPYGTRMFFEATRGTATGACVNGELKGGGGDWILVGPDGFGRIDVRFQLETNDSAFIYAQYFGVLEMNENCKLQWAMRRAPNSAIITYGHASIRNRRRPLRVDDPDRVRG